MNARPVPVYAKPITGYRNGVSGEGPRKAVSVSELNELAAQQQRDDISYQDPQRFAGVRAVPLQKFVDHGRDGSDMETVRDTVDHGATEVGGVARPQTRWGPGRTHPVYRPRTVRDRDAYRAPADGIG